MIQAERIRALNNQRGQRGDYVLYWMQQSQRAETNHALEYAIREANRLGLPELVGDRLGDEDVRADLERRLRLLVVQFRRRVDDRCVGRGRAQRVVEVLEQRLVGQVERGLCLGQGLPTQVDDADGLEPRLLFEKADQRAAHAADADQQTARGHFTTVLH